MSPAAIDKEVHCLHHILSAVDTPAVFCRVTELVDRNPIRRKERLILHEASHYRLRPFRFLINLN